MTPVKLARCGQMPDVRLGVTRGPEIRRVEANATGRLAPFRYFFNGLLNSYSHGD